MSITESPPPGLDHLQALVVEASDPVLQRLAGVLRYDGWTVTHTDTAAGAAEHVAQHRPDVVLVGDDQDAGEVFAQIRHLGSLVPLLFLYDPEQPRSRVAGRTAGGDDVLVKPFSIETMQARMRGLVRRARLLNGDHLPSRYTVGDLALDEDTREVTRGDQAIHLTSTEFDFLRFLMRNPQRVLTKSKIKDRVWKYDDTGALTVVDVYVGSVRKKLDTGHATMLRTVRGAGYMLKATG